MTTGQSRRSRRNFLLAVGTGGAAAVLVGNGDRVPQPETPEKLATSTGYRLTEHIRNYYRTAKV